MNRMVKLLFAITLVIGTAGCSLDGLTVDSSVHEGRWLNGRWLNGRWLNGTSTFVTAAYPNRTMVDGVVLFGTKLGAAEVDDVEVFATELSSAPWGISGTDFVGATMSAIDNDRNPLTLRIDDIIPQPSGLFYYEITAIYEEREEPLCEPTEPPEHMSEEDREKFDRSNGRAVPIAGIWNHKIGERGAGGKIPGSAAHGITFGCLNVGATAKCVQMGYWPWLDRDHDLAHQSCVRMVRADYCGNGMSWTENGTPIDVEDEIPEQFFAEYIPHNHDDAWVFEATWGPDGASCIEAYRYETENKQFKMSVEEAIERKLCPNIPRPVDFEDADNVLGEAPAGQREGMNLCDWQQPEECDPTVQTCPVDQGMDYDIFGFTVVNANVN